MPVSARETCVSQLDRVRKGHDHEANAKYTFCKPGMQHGPSVHSMVNRH